MNATAPDAKPVARQSSLAVGVADVQCVPRPHCEHDWQITGYSYVAPSRDPYDRPDTVFLRCRKCGEEWMEDFQ